MKTITATHHPAAAKPGFSSTVSYQHHTEMLENRARLCRALTDLIWWSRQDAALWLGVSVPTLDRVVKANDCRIRTYSSGGRKLIHGKDLIAFTVDASVGGGETAE